MTLIWRETEGRTQERYLFVNGIGTRGRVAGGRTRTVGGFAEIGWEWGGTWTTDRDYQHFVAPD